MNYKKLSEWQSGFVQWVLLRHPKEPGQQNGFMGGFIYGERGSGKSTYCYKTMAKTYYELNGFNGSDGEAEAYRIALDYFMFDPELFRDLLNVNKLLDIVTPIVCLDDASMHFGNMLHITNPKEYSALMGETATIRTVITGFLITAPVRRHVARFLRDYDDFKGEVKTDKNGGHTPGRDTPTWNKKVRYYKWNYYPDEVRYKIQIPFQDRYSCYIPEPYYSAYVLKKKFFEVKYEMGIADKINKKARAVFMKYPEKLPSYPGQPDLKMYIKKWEREAEEEKKEEERTEQLKKMRDFEHKKKWEAYLEKLKKIENLQEKIGDI